MSILHRQDTAFFVAADGSLQPLDAGTVTVYDIGGVASQTTNTITINLYAGHGFAVTDCIMVGTDESTFRSIDVVNPTSIEVNSAVSVTVGDLIVNLGADSAGGSGTPNYDGSTVEIYDVPDDSSPLNDSEVTIDATGNYGYYFNAEDSVWELVRNSNGDVEYVLLRDTASLLTPSGTPFVDNAIARWDGTTGLLIQSAYTSNTPTITDAGGITAAGTHILGRTGATTTLAGALAVAEATTLTGVVTAPAANSFGTTGNTNTFVGSVAVTQGLTVGTSATVATTLDVGGDSTLAKTTTAQLNASVGTAPTVGTLVNWGTGPSASIASGGRDNRFTINVTAGTGTGTNPASLIVTFNGTFAAAAPIAVVALNTNASSQGVGVGLSWAVTPTTLTLTYRGASTASGTYRFDVIVLG